MAVADLLHGVHGQHPDGVDGLVVELGPLQVGCACVTASSRRGCGQCRALLSGARLDSHRLQCPSLDPQSTALHLEASVTYVGPVGPAHRGRCRRRGPRPRRATVRDVVAAYVGLTKPRVIELLLLTTVPVMFFAARGVPPLGPGRGHRRRRHLLGRVGVGVQLRLRPRHRRADAAHPAPGAAAPHRLAARRAGLRRRARRRSRPSSCCSGSTRSRRCSRSRPTRSTSSATRCC